MGTRVPIMMTTLCRLNMLHASMGCAMVVLEVFAQVCAP
jgi:hypothetical protein